VAHKQLAVALGMIVAVSPLSAASLKPNPATIDPADSGARYCLRVEPFTDSRIETVRCWTRAEWAAQGVDVDKDWPKEGVQIIR